MAVFQIFTRIPLGSVQIGVALALLPGTLAQAQTSGDAPFPRPQSPPSVESYSLPPGPESTSEQDQLQGPVDSEIPLANPAIVPPRPRPDASPPTQQPLQPDSQATAPVTAEGTGGAGREPARQPATAAQPSAEISPTEADSSATQPDSATNEGGEPLARPNDADVQPRKSPAEKIPENATASWALWIFAALLFALLGGFLLWRRRRTAPEQPIAPPFAKVPDARTTARSATVTKVPEPPLAAPTITIGFQPRSANATLINAVLKFELTLSNPRHDDLTNIRINGAMDQARQDGSRNPVLADLSLMQEVQCLSRGKHATILTEFRIPLTSISPIIFQSQALFVPMVQFAVEFTDGNGGKHVQTASFLVGREHQPPRPRMAPFRLDLGPRSFAPVGCRTLTTS